MKARVYRLLCEGFSQRKIAVICGVTRQRISQVTNELVHERYVYSPFPSAKPRLYKPTDTPYPLQPRDVKQIRGGRNQSSTEICRAHSLAFILPILRPFVYPPRWIKVWTNNGTRYSQLSRESDIGEITVRWIQGRESSQLVFFLPEKYLTKEELKRYDRTMNRYIGKFIGWFEKTYKCKLGVPDLYQKPEFAVAEDPEVVFIGNRYNIRCESSWVDCSEGTPEWETNDIEVARAKLESGERLLKMEQRIDKIERMMVGLDSKLDRVLNLFEPQVVSGGRVETEGREFSWC